MQELDLLARQEEVVVRMSACHCRIVDAKEGFQEALSITDHDSESGILGTVNVLANLGRVSHPTFLHRCPEVDYHVLLLDQMLSIMTRSQVFDKDILTHEL